MCKLVTSFKVLDIAKICLLRTNTLAYFILGLNDEAGKFYDDECWLLLLPLLLLLHIWTDSQEY
jgi:hypothetical protein